MFDAVDPGAAQAAAPGSLVVKRRFITWEDGNPVVDVEDVLTKAAIQDTYMAAAAEPYEPNPNDPHDARYAGLSCAEVAIRKQAQAAARTGDAEIFMDRLIGKPKQTVEATKLTLTYEDTLKEIARKETLKLPPAPHQRVIDPILSQL